MPPDDFCNCFYDVRATKPMFGSQFLAGTETSISFLFLRTTPPIAGQWHAASRATSASPTPVLVRPVTRFAQPRCLRERPTTAELPRRCIVRINVHGSKDRVKDASRSACDGVPCLRPVPTLIERRPTAFPSSASFGHPLSPARSPTAEEAAMTDNEPT